LKIIAVEALAGTIRTTLNGREICYDSNTDYHE
jgi:hypothetical protein